MKLRKEAGYYLDESEWNHYQYIAGNSKVHQIIMKAKEEKIKYSYVLCYLIKNVDRWEYFSVHFMNKDNQEIAYAILDLFDMFGFTKFETPRVWGIDFLINKAYFRIDKKDFKKNHNVIRPDEAISFNKFFKRTEKYLS